MSHFIHSCTLNGYPLTPPWSPVVNGAGSGTPFGPVLQSVAERTGVLACVGRVGADSYMVSVYKTRAERAALHAIVTAQVRPLPSPWSALGWPPASVPSSTVLPVLLLALYTAMAVSLSQCHCALSYNAIAPCHPPLLTAVV